jgi:acetyl esterase/lipase
LNRSALQHPVLCGVLMLYGYSAALAQRSPHAKAIEQGHSTASGCYDASNQSDVRLWEGHAPGADGDDPCRDIPYVQVYRPVPGNRSRAAILIIPGGGYDSLTNVKEQSPVAEYFANTLHVTAFVLRYRLTEKDGTYRYPTPMWDGQRALKLIRARAEQFGFDPHHVVVFGFSAGGHLASTITLHSATDFGLPVHDAIDSEPGRPDLLGLGYPVISMDPAAVPPSGSFRNLLRDFNGTERAHLEKYLSGEKNVTPRTPPVFLFESMDDAVVSPQNSVLFIEALKAQGIPIDSQLFQHGLHGSGLAVGLPEESAWPEMFRRWLVAQGFLQN